MVQSVSVAVLNKESSTPPPPSAEFPLMVQSVSVAVLPIVVHPAAESAEFPLMVQLVSVAVPSLSTPPPKVADPAGDGQAREGRGDAAIHLEHTARCPRR